MARKENQVSKTVELARVQAYHDNGRGRMEHPSHWAHSWTRSMPGRFVLAMSPSSRFPSCPMENRHSPNTAMTLPPTSVPPPPSGSSMSKPVRTGFATGSSPRWSPRRSMQPITLVSITWTCRGLPASSSCPRRKAVSSEWNTIREARSGSPCSCKRRNTWRTNRKSKTFI